MRRKSRITNKIEKASGDDTWRAIRFAHVVSLVIDASMMLERQDLNIARLVIEEGRSLLIAVNKWDLIRDKSKAIKELERRIKISLPQVKDIPYVPISALKNRNLDGLIDKSFLAYDVWNQMVPTAKLNRWFAMIVERHPPPLVQGRRIKLRYITQIKTARLYLFVSVISPTRSLRLTNVMLSTNCVKSLFCLVFLLDFQ